MLVPLPVTIDREHSEKSPSHTKCSINISDDDKKRGGRREKGNKEVEGGSRSLLCD